MKRQRIDHVAEMDEPIRHAPTEHLTQGRRTAPRWDLPVAGLCLGALALVAIGALLAMVFG